MLVLLGFAFVSGIITILSPCILPVLPIVLSGSVGGGRARPFGVLTGFVVSFTAFTLALSAIVKAIGIPVDTLRIVAVVLIGLFGVVLLVPRLRDGFELLAGRVARAGNRVSAAANRGPVTRPVPTAGGQPLAAASIAGAAPLAAATRAAAAGPAARARNGYWSGTVVGVSLGLVWTPCVGPIMASVISLAVSQHVDGGSVLITLAYTLGTSIPMLAVMLGGRALLTRVPALTRNTVAIQRVFGAVMIFIAVAVGLGWDRQFQSAVLRAFPNYGSGLTAVETTSPVRTALKARTQASAPAVKAAPGVFAGAPDTSPSNAILGDYGLAPGFLTKGEWFNTEGLTPGGGMTAQGGSMPLTMAGLRGKVVVIDFWTYSCVNCVRTLPYIKAWYDTYRDKGLVIVGVHTPEFAFERNPENVARAIATLGVGWPVVQDNDYLEWNAYANQYWPADYFIDARGHVRYFHFGEGDYADGERVIQELLRQAGASVSGLVSKPAPQIDAQTPETYLGYDRGSGFMSSVDPVPDKPAAYKPGAALGVGDWSLDGTWTITPQYIVPTNGGTLEFKFDAKNVFLVIEPQGRGGSVQVSVDGAPPADTPDVKAGVLRPTQSRLYQLVGLGTGGTHDLRLKVDGQLRFFAFTFG